MTPDDGDDDDAPLGPPPDPSLRQWRHPSEIASANAAALRDISPAQPARWRSLPFVGGCAIGLIGMTILGTAVARPFVSGADDLDAQALLTTSTPAWTTTDGDLPSPSTTVDRSIDEPTDDTHPSDAGSTDTSTSVITQVIAPATLPPTLEAGASGVIGILDVDSQARIATGLVVDGMVITSAYAVGDRTEVLLDLGSGQVQALVVGTDPFNDLAVIATLEPDRLPAPILLTALEPADDPAADSTVSSSDIAAPDALDLAPGSTVWILATSDQPTPTAVGGEIAALGQDVMTVNGTMIFDALQTTIRTPVYGRGGAVVDEDGATIAMVIACDRHLASAIPIETLRSTAQSIRETGWGHIGWLGLKGEGSDDGIELLSVEPNGPAAAAGLAAGDVLLSVDGEPLQHLAGIVRAIRQAGVGQQVVFEVRRGDDTFSASIMIGTRIG